MKTKVIFLIMWSVFVVLLSIPLIGFGCPIVRVARFGEYAELLLIINIAYIVIVNIVDILIIKKIQRDNDNKSAFHFCVAIIIVQLWCLEVWFESAVNILKSAFSSGVGFIMFLVTLGSFGYTLLRAKQLSWE